MPTALRGRLAATPARVHGAGGLSCSLEALPLTAQRQARPQGAARARPRRPIADARLRRAGRPSWRSALAADLGRGARASSGSARHDNFFELGGHSLLAMQADLAAAPGVRRRGAARALFAPRRPWPSFAQAVGSGRARAPCRRSCRADATRRCRCPSRSSGCGSWRRWRASARPITSRWGCGLSGDAGPRRLARRAGRARRPARGAAHHLRDGRRSTGSAHCGRGQRLRSAGVDDLRRPRRRRRVAAAGIEEANAAFDLQAGPLIRGRLIRLDDRRASCCSSPCTTSSPTAGRWAC